jgi:hypothetical protein
VVYADEVVVPATSLSSMYSFPTVICGHEPTSANAAPGTKPTSHSTHPLNVVRAIRLDRIGQSSDLGGESAGIRVDIFRGAWSAAALNATT